MNKLFPVVFVIAGLALLIFGSSKLLDGFSSKDWKVSQGVITESRLVDQGSSSKSKGKNYKPVIVYSYTVDGEEYTSDRILFGMSSYRTISKSGEQVSKEWVSKYPQESEVTVYYDPSDHEQSTLNTGSHFTAWIAPAMGLLFLAISLLMFKPAK